MQLRSTGILSIGVLSISTGAIFTRFAQAAGVGSIEIAAFRLLLAVLILTPFVVFKYWKTIRALDRKTLATCILAGSFLAVHFATWITSLEYTSISSSVVLVTTTPLWVSLYTMIRSRQKLDLKTGIGLVVVILGGILVTAAEICGFQSSRLICSFTETGKLPLLGNFLALFGSWMAAGYLITGKRIRSSIQLTPYIFLVYGVGAGILILLSLSIHNNQIFTTPVDGWVWLFALAIIPQLMGHSAFNWSLKHFSTTLVSVIIQAEPIGSTILGIFLFRELPTTLKWIGVLTILSGIFLVSLAENQSSQQKVDEISLPV